MEKSFKNYYLEGLKNSYKTIYKKKRNLFKFYICFFIYILSIPLFILKPVINLGIFRLGNQINDDNDIDITSLTKACDNPKNYFTTLFAGLIKILIIIGIILFWVVIAGVSAGIGLIIMKFTGKNDYSIVLLFATPALLVLLIYLIMIPIVYVEIGYIVNSNNDINASNALNISFNAYKKEGKKARFLIMFVNCFILVSYLAIFGVVAALPIIINGYSSINLGITLLIVVLVLIPYSMLAPLFVLGTISSLTLLNDDVVKDTLTDVVSVTNVKFHIPNKNMEDLTTEEKLAYIFDKADGLKPNINDLRIIDSLDIVDEDGTYISGDSTKEVELKEDTIDEQAIDQPKEESIEQVLSNNFMDDVSEDIKKELKEDFTEDMIEDKQDDSIIENVEEESSNDEMNWSDEQVENNNEAIEENIDIKENDEEVEEDKEEVNPEILTDNQEENLTTDESIDIEEVKDDNIIVEENLESPMEDNVKDESIDGVSNEEIEQQEIIENDNEKVEEVKDESNNEDFDLDLFEEEKPKDDDSDEVELEEFLKKGDE